MLVAVAVNITELPIHTGPAGVAVIFMAGVIFGFTVIDILLDVAAVGEPQFALEVRITFTISPFTKAEVEYIGVFVPTFTPFTCH